MSIKEWIKSKGSYEEGVALYANHPKRSSHILRTLRKSRNRGLLLYELNKLLKYEQKQPPKQEPKIIEKTSEKTFERNFPTIKVYQLPEELREPFIKQKQSFYEALRLKYILNDLPDAEVQKAREISEKIIRLFDFIDEVWRLIDYWFEHKELFPTTPAVDYSEFTPKELFNTRQRLYVRVSKRKKTLEKMMETAAELPDGKEKNLLMHKIEKKKRELMQLEVDIRELSKLLRDE